LFPFMTEGWKVINSLIGNQSAKTLNCQSDPVNIELPLTSTLCVCVCVCVCVSEIGRHGDNMIDRLTPPPGALLKGNKETMASACEGLQHER